MQSKSNDIVIRESICCSFCNSLSMTEVMDFGEVALAGGFLKPNQFLEESFYPLRLFFCQECYAIQLINKVSAQILFKEYFYFSSSIQTLKDHFVEYAKEITSRFLTPEVSTVLEFGCNDGVLLRPLADQNIKTVLGVDPATNVISTIDDPRITIINDFFNENIAKEVVAKYGRVDLVVANNVYAHIPDIQGVTRAVHDVLSDDGVFIFEVHYLGNVIDELQYDMIYHEHLYYYSLLSAINHFERYEMVIFDVKSVPIHAGSLRLYVCKKGSEHSFVISPEVIRLKNEELSRGFNLSVTFQRFASEVDGRKRQLLDLLRNLKKQGHSIAGYGASGRANTMIQYCKIDNNYLDYMIDDAPAKIGFYTPGSHFKIFSSSILDNKDPPDYLLIFAWSFLEEIARRNKSYLDCGGKFIIPLPEVKIFSKLG
jgi:methylation protein EvaC